MRGPRCAFTSVSSGRTLRDAIRSAAQDSGGWLIDPVNGATARWGGAAVQGTRHAARGRRDAIGFSWHHAIATCRRRCTS